jgi:hypothetical protein
MKWEYSLQKAPRCSATSKRTRERCKALAVRGWTVCRFHGARGGAPKGKANGAYKHGLHTKEVFQLANTVPLFEAPRKFPPLNVVP